MFNPFFQYPVGVACGLHVLPDPLKWIVNSAQTKIKSGPRCAWCLVGTPAL